MYGLQRIAEFFVKEWEVIAGAPLSFTLAVLVVGAAVGWCFGFFAWELRGWAARSKMDQLREEKTAEDDVLEIVRASHEHEVVVREEIEAEFERLHSVVDRLHGGNTNSDRLITDATAATERAVEELKQAHEEFLHHMQQWDDEHLHHHERPAFDHQD